MTGVSADPPAQYQPGMALTPTLHTDLLRLSVLIEGLGHILDSEPTAYEALSRVYARGEWILPQRDLTGALDREWVGLELLQAVETIHRIVQVFARSRITG